MTTLAPAAGGVRVPARIIVTASRQHRDRSLIWGTLDGLYDRFGGPLLIVHGDAKGVKGAPGGDRLAKEWAWVRKAAGWDVDQEPHPADWDAPCRPECHHGPRGARGDGSTFCIAAGEYRNHVMGDLGAALCAAFPLPGSVGTWRMVEYARAKGIPDLVTSRTVTT